MATRARTTTAPAKSSPMRKAGGARRAVVARGATGASVVAKPAAAAKAAKAENPDKADKATKADRALKPLQPLQSSESAVTPKPSKAAKPAKVEKSPKGEKPAKSEKPARKEKLVRDSFTMPESDFKLIASVKQRALQFQHAAKKSEVLRAGLMALQGLSEPQLRALLESLPVIKTGRPKKVG